MSSLLHGRTSLGGGRLAAFQRPPVAPTMTFPILGVDEIVTALAEVGITLTDEDLVKARPEVIKVVFDQLIVMVLNITKDELYQAKFAGLSALEQNSELHEESVHVMHWIRSMNKLLTAAGMAEGYTLKDLMKPDRARVQKALSGIINLHKFKESVQDDYNSLVQTSLDLMEERRKVDEETESLRLELANMRFLREQEKPEAIALEASVAALVAQKAALDREAAATRAAGLEQKSATAAMADEIARISGAIAAAKADVEAARAQVVASPRRIRDELDAAVRGVEAAKAEFNHAEDDRRALERRLEVVAKADRDVAKLLALLAEVDVEMSRHKSLHKAIKARSAELDAANAELSTSQAALRAAEDTLRSREATLSELRSEYEMRAGSTDRGVIALRAELRALQEGVAAALAARAAAEARRAALEESKERAVAAHTLEMADMTAAARKLATAVAEYHAGVFKAVGAAAAAGPIMPAARSAATITASMMTTPLVTPMAKSTPVM